jgi:hypothetical protein
MTARLSFRGAPISVFTRVFDALWARARNPERQAQNIGLWIPGSLAEPVIGPASGRTRRLAPRNDVGW